MIRLPTLAETLRTLASQGKKGFYTGRVAKAIIDVVRLCGGQLEMEDLQHHLDMKAQNDTPLSIPLTGHGIGQSNSSTNAGMRLDLWEHPPNGQGIVALEAMGILQELERQGIIESFSPAEHNSTRHLHAVIESLRIAFADAKWWVTDPHPDHSPDFQRPSGLISPKYLRERAKLFSTAKCSDPPVHGYPSGAESSCDTVYFCVTDKAGNGVSFINSLYSSFGSGIVPKDCGFALQNRGANFQLGPENHPNLFAPRKRPYHTIIPALVTQGEEERRRLHCVFGVMGGFMQPQGHVQVLMNMEVFGMDAQQALDAPRVCIGAVMSENGDSNEESAHRTIYLEEGIPEKSISGLRDLGYQVLMLKRFSAMFGRGQVIRSRYDEASGRTVYSGGSDPRGDGHAIPG